MPKDNPQTPDPAKQHWKQLIAHQRTPHPAKQPTNLIWPHHRGPNNTTNKTQKIKPIITRSKAGLEKDPWPNNGNPPTHSYIQTGIFSCNQNTTQECLTWKKNPTPTAKHGSSPPAPERNFAGNDKKLMTTTTTMSFNPSVN
ncbi:hypothetical protein SLA2020_435190 [Shorea laevis]